MPTWKLNRTVTQMAEAAGFEFALAQVKWRGYGGASAHWDYSLESFTLISALAAVTDRIQLYASVGIKSIHPVIAAKMAVTLDEVSGGRFGLNIVAGWNQFEYAQMGLWDGDEYYRLRYDYAEEYFQVLSRLWATGRASFSGRYFQVEDCASLPVPGRRLPIICAGQSADSLAFTARHGDFGFVGRQKDTPESLGELGRRLTGLGAAQGRRVGCYTLLNVIAEATEAEAIARRDHFVAHSDPVAIEEWVRTATLDTNRSGYDQLTPLQRTFGAQPYIASSYEKVAAHFDALAAEGLAGACLVFPDFTNDLARFIEHVVPRMTCRGGARRLSQPRMMGETTT